MKLKMIFFVTAAIAGAACTPMLAQTNLRVLGQPTSTGLIAKTYEAPFFKNLAEVTGLNVNVEYTPLDVTGMKDTEQLRLLKNGLFDIVSVRVPQASRDEPTVLGLDLIGQNPDYETARRTIDAFFPVVDAQLQKKFNTKLLSVWPFGPQVLFCRPDISGLSDLSGKKVRVYDQNLAEFISAVGGVGVPVDFSEVYQSLARGVIDCAITGASSANTAGWPEVTSIMLPIAFNMGTSGYAINLGTWNKFSPEEQKELQSAFDDLSNKIWSASEEIFEDAVRCNVGEEPCNTVQSYDLKLVPVSEDDKALMQTALQEISFPNWKELCDKVNPTCSEDWINTVGKALGR